MCFSDLLLYRLEERASDANPGYLFYSLILTNGKQIGGLSNSSIDQSPHSSCETGVRVPSSSCFSKSATIPGVKRKLAHANIFIPKAKKSVKVMSNVLEALPMKHPARYAMMKSMRRSRAWFNR